MFSYFAHRKACLQKQEERRNRIQSLPDRYHEPPTSHDSLILSTSISDLVTKIKTKEWSPFEVILAYGRKALKAHEVTNCLTEVMIASAEDQATKSEGKGPLAGVPVSLKDSCAVAGYDSSIGYSAFGGSPAERDSPLVKLLKDAGAIPFVKTAVPITLMSFESANDVFGICKNPHKLTHSPGGSTGGESALLAFGGSRIGIGTDVAGSVRLPAHYAGVYAIRSSVGRFPKPGPRTSMPGQEGVPSICAPMARTLDDLETFWKAVVSMKPWEYDHSCHPIPWRDVPKPEAGKTKWGVMWDDGMVTPSPPCTRALMTIVQTLMKEGHEVVAFEPPSPAEGFEIGSQLIFADGGKTMMKPFRWFERNDLGAQNAYSWLKTPRFIKKIYAFIFRYLSRDSLTATIVGNLGEKTVEEQYALNARREAYKAKWFEAWKAQDIDYLLTVPNALPAVPHGGMKTSVASVGYSFLFNIIDYTAGVLPVTHVDAKLDSLPADFKPKNAIERGHYKLYDVNAMNGLPIGVQVVGRRLEEEKVLEGMKAISAAMTKNGIAYNLFEA
ncbi:amidase signature enzyme [Sistotremastrum suecicum HHB10207 ss-3]|uniref:amidase n=1 Tax=Sistotremastrum suecicum HHB10207 ss-3 TaxID=1314776 RepID=A0A166AZE4_9AGAM|nr:amidase signature enzyme [Sistotremastrum suecicum HHB10207 ss-3]